MVVVVVVVVSLLNEEEESEDRKADSVVIKSLRRLSINAPWGNFYDALRLT